MTYDVIIAGAGPTGMTLGILLGQQGHRVLIAERHEQPYPLPRAIHLDDETARILQRCGLHEALEGMTPGTSYEWQNGNGQTLLRFAMSLQGSQGWPQANMFNQPHLERSMRERVGELSNVTLSFGTSVGHFHEDETSVVAELQHSGHIAQTRASYLVGCDGANSTIRDVLGIPMQDQGFFFDWLVADIELNEERDFEPSMLQICDPTRPTTLMPGGSPRQRRWEFMALPGETLDDLANEEKFWELLAPYDITFDNASVVRSAGYRFMARWAQRWRRGRVFLAGDAAHQMPPFAGQGMCAGIRDASNLAFKLDLALRGFDVLDTYDQERLPHVEAVIGFAMELGKIICVTDVKEADSRDEMFIPLVSDHGASEVPGMPPIMSGLIGESPLAGELFPQGSIVVNSRSVRADDVISSRWRLFTQGDEYLEADLAEWFQQLGGSVVNFENTQSEWDNQCQQWMIQHDIGAVLQRPDFRIFDATSKGSAQRMVARLREFLTR